MPQNDANGNPLVTGGRYVAAGKLRIDAATGRVLLVGDKGRALEVDPDDVVPAGLVNESGFVDRSESAISWDDATRTLTISPTGASFVFYQRGVRYEKSAPDAVQITDTEGLHYIYYDAGVLSVTTTFSLDIITEFPFVAAVEWDVAEAEAIIVGDERHGRDMDSATHRYNHSTFGARWGGGLALGDLDIDGSGDDASAAQLSVSDGSLWDEDIEHVVTNGAPQTLAPIAQVPMFYRSGVNGDWHRLAATNYPVATTGTGRCAWNEYTGSTWQLSEVGNNDFACVHLFATGDTRHPIIGMVGHATYPTVASARQGAEVEIRSLAFGVLEVLTPENVPIATLIVETGNAYGNAVKSRFRSTDAGADYIDWRGGVGGSAGGVGAITDHQLLGNRDGDLAHPQYLLLSGGTLTGPVVAPDPTLTTHLTNLGYVAGLLTGYALASHVHTLAQVTDSGALAALDGLNLDDLDDVGAFGTLFGGEQLSYNAGAGEWQAQTAVALGALAYLNSVAESNLAAALLAKIDAGSVALTRADGYLNGTQGLGSAATGSPTYYVGNPRYIPAEKTIDAAPMVKIDGQSSTGSTQARIVYYFSRVWLADLRAFRFRVRLANTAGALAARWGLHSDDDTSPNASGRPAGGVWIEWDSTVSATVIYLCTSDGSTVTATACTSLVLNDLNNSSGGKTLWLVFESTSSVKLYADDADGTHTLEATNTTNIPSDDTSRACRPFLQLEKDSSNTTRPDAAMEPPAWTRDTLAAGSTPP
jgi:hypothetical protein